MSLEPGLQSRLYDGYWRPMEIEFGQEGYAAHFDPFMRHYLTVRTGEIPNEREVYEAFKRYSQESAVAAAGVEELVKDIRTCSSHYCRLSLGKESDRDLAAVFHDIRELRVQVAMPLLLELYADYESGLWSKADFLQACRLLESYVFRRAVCGMPTNSLNKTFATFSKALRKDRYLESVEAHYLTLQSYRSFPTDDDFIRDIQTRDLYNFPRRSYWLRRLENQDSREWSHLDNTSIEHIMPQTDNLSDQWKADLGTEWERIHGTYLHTLGNLTLTAYNTELSARPFHQKRDMPNGFRESPLRLNQSLRELGTWNEDMIRARAQTLAEWAVRVWKAPSLPQSVLVGYRKRTASTTYGLSEHVHLGSGKMAEVFDDLRRQILAIDACVSEEFFKYYVAYKAETNFVDVTGQAGHLRLILNMPFFELEDSKGIARDVSSIGTWGNGDIEVRLTTTEEIPYAISLVRQAFDRQMGDS